MTKNTTDELREQIQSCFKRNLMQTEGDTELFDTELTIDNLLALISNREKLARKKALNDMTVWANNEMAKDWVRKELDGEEPTNE